MNDLPNIVFFGTPEFAAHALDALIKSQSYDIKAVVTQPDKPSGRGQELTPPPVKVLAEKNAIPVFQPATLKSIVREGTTLKDTKGENPLVTFLNNHAPFAIFVTAAYGKIIPESLIGFPEHGIINIHASLLPRWRGAAPIQHAIFAGDTETGICIMDVDEGLDTGGVYSEAKIPVLPSDTCGTLHDRLKILGAELLTKTLPDILSRNSKLIPQPSTGATYADKWEKEDAKIFWTDAPEITERRIRASCPYLGGITMLSGEQVKFFSVEVVTNFRGEESKAPGTVVIARDELIVRAGPKGYIKINELQFPGKKKIAAKDAINGGKINVGDVFGE